MTTVALYQDYLLTDNLWSNFDDELNPIEIPNSKYAKIMLNDRAAVAVAGDFGPIHQFKRWFYGEVGVFASDAELGEHLHSMAIIWYSLTENKILYSNGLMSYTPPGGSEPVLVTTGSGAPFFISALKASHNDPFVSIVKSKEFDRATGGKTIYVNLKNPTDNNLPMDHADVAACYADLDQEVSKMSAQTTTTKILASLKAPIGLPAGKPLVDQAQQKEKSQDAARTFLQLTGRNLNAS